MWISISAALLLVGTPAIAPPAGLAGVTSVGPLPSVLQEAPTPPMTPDQAQAAFIALEDEFEEALNASFAEIRAKMKAHREAGGDRSTFESPEPIEPAYFPRFQALVDAGVPAANAWCLSNHMFSGHTGDQAKQDKTQRLLSLLAASPEDDVLDRLCDFLRGEAVSSSNEKGTGSKLGEESAFAFLDVIRATAKTDDVKAMTLYSRGSAIKARRRSDPEADVSGANAWFERASLEYPTTKMGIRCGGYAFAANHLQIGQEAPDIVGKDHDGNDIRRSDFEGKVTVLDFWGFW